MVGVSFHRSHDVTRPAAAGLHPQPTARGALLADATRAMAEVELDLSSEIEEHLYKVLVVGDFGVGGSISWL